MKIYIGADHAGFELKEKLKIFLAGLGYEVEDKGAFKHDPEDDYPDFILPVAKAIEQDPEHSRGVVIGGSGQGEAIIANRIRGVRAAVFYGGSFDIIKLSRAHNDANILSLGARFVSEEDAKKALEIWLSTPFESGRHQRRIAKIDQ